MHKSRLGGFIIDCQTEELEAATAFWSAALGLKSGPTLDPGGAKYRRLETAGDEPHLEVQAVRHPSRVHLDIETDDIPAEVVRLERLGAQRVDAVHDWVVMQAPTGQRFCVVRAQRRDFERHANRWP